MKYVITVIYVYINDYCLGYSKTTLGLQVIFSYAFSCLTETLSRAGVCTTNDPVH